MSAPLPNFGTVSLTLGRTSLNQVDFFWCQLEELVDLGVDDFFVAGDFRVEFGDAGAAFFKVRLPGVPVFEGDGGFVLFFEFCLKGFEIESMPIREAFGKFGAFAAGDEISQDAAGDDGKQVTACFGGGLGGFCQAKKWETISKLSAMNLACEMVKLASREFLLSSTVIEPPLLMA